MFIHWLPCAISPRCPCFMYKEYYHCTPQDTCIGLRKSCRIIKVIWYMGSSSGFSLSTGFFDFFGTSSSRTVNKHNLMIVKTLFWSNHFLLNNKQNKKEIPFSEKGFTRCFGQAMKVFKACPTNWTSSIGVGMWASRSQISSTPTFTTSFSKRTWCTVDDPS